MTGSRTGTEAGGPAAAPGASGVALGAADERRALLALLALGAALYLLAWRVAGPATYPDAAEAVAADLAPAPAPATPLPTPNAGERTGPAGAGFP
jgi:hypothetical protein